MTADAWFPAPRSLGRLPASGVRNVLRPAVRRPGRQKRLQSLGDEIVSSRPARGWPARWMGDNERHEAGCPARRGQRALRPLMVGPRRLHKIERPQWLEGSGLPMCPRKIVAVESTAASSTPSPQNLRDDDRCSARDHQGAVGGKGTIMLRRDEVAVRRIGRAPALWPRPPSAETSVCLPPAQGGSTPAGYK